MNQSHDIHSHLSATISLLDDVIDDQKNINVDLFKLFNDGDKVVQTSGKTKSKSFDFLPKQNYSLQQVYHMNRDKDTYRLLSKECQRVSYTDITSSKYEVTLQKTFDNFCHCFKIEMEAWFHLCEDDYLKEIVLLDKDERFPSHKLDTWWMDLPN